MTIGSLKFGFASSAGILVSSMTIASFALPSSLVKRLSCTLHSTTVAAMVMLGLYQLLIGLLRQPIRF